MKFTSPLIVALLIGLYLSSTSSHAQDNDRQDAARKLEFFKQNVRAIGLKQDHQVVKGRLSRFSKAGIVFNPAKSGPFFDPKPTFYPISQVEAFLDANGRVLWSRPGSDYAQPAVRRGVPFRVRIGLQYGVGTHLDAYTSPISTEGYDDYVQDIKTGSQPSADVLVFLQRNLGLGFKYVLHSSSASYHGLRVDNNLEDMPSLDTIEEDFDVSTMALFVSFFQPVTGSMLFHADLGLGQSTFTTPGQFLPEPQEISANTFSAYVGTGFDYSFTRNIAVGFDVSLLLGGISEEIEGAEQTIEFQQNLNRLDINAGLRFFF